MTLILAFAVAQAVLGYFLSEADRRKLGRTPWGLPSMVWALLWFMSWILGLILYLVAHRAEIRKVAGTPSRAVDDGDRFESTTSAKRSTGSDFPAYPRPAGGGTPPGPLPAPVAASIPAGDTASPSWQPDPSGRFHYRWWSGTEWTSHVATNGQVVVDTSPDQRIGPY
jgi:hypothetical protein